MVAASRYGQGAIDAASDSVLNEVHYLEDVVKLSQTSVAHCERRRVFVAHQGLMGALRPG
jgi:hypothetical protein